MKFVICHSNADLDAIASMVGISKLYPDVQMILGRNMNPSVQRFLSMHKDLYPMLTLEVALEKAERSGVSKIFVVDTADSRRVAEFEALFTFEPEVEVFDHHPPSAFDLQSDLAHVDPVGACITLLVEEMIGKGTAFDSRDATLFMLALYSDTGRLSYCTTTSRDLAIAHVLLKHGAQLRIVNRYLSKEFSEEQVHLLGDLLKEVHEVSVGSVEVAIASAEFDFNIRGAALVVQQVMDFGGHSAILALIRTKNRIQLIARSQISYFDVGKFCRQFGGGGHPGAGSAAFKKRQLDDVKAEVLASLEAFKMSPIRVFEIMSTEIVYLDSTTIVESARSILSEKKITGAPVRKAGETVGIFSKRDLEKARQSDGNRLPVSAFMTSKVVSIDYMEPIDDALALMTEMDIGRLMVVHKSISPDAPNSEVGILTRSDLLRKLYMVHDAELLDLAPN